MPRAAAAKLATYRAKRDFAQTPEPSGARAPAAAGRSYVIQQHDARRMHYDFRLEHDGVLLSWAVPKGPSLEPSARRLAVRTEDHPLDYGDFEGAIPEGQYGAGSVIVWDRGTWEPEGDAAAELARGRLSFVLHGEKLRGRWHLIRTRGGDPKRESWLLFKARDDESSTRDVVADRPASVLSGRTVSDIAAAPPRVWRSDRATEPTVLEKRAARIAQAAHARRAAPPASKTSKPAHARRAAPRTSKPAHARRAAPRGPGELHELLARLPLGFPLTNLDKVLYPEAGITKGELIAYLAIVADSMLPHAGNRPLTIVRCPDGRAKCFYQKHVLAGSPPPIRRVPLEETDGSIVEYMAFDDLPGLVALAQLGTLEIHTWGSHADRPERPDLLVFDLDPDVGLPWDRVAATAFELRRRLRELELESFVKTTGGKGLHVVAPVARRLAWDDFKAFAKDVVTGMARAAPDLYTTNMSKAQRRGKMFLDYLRNGRNATFIAPYSPRARPGAPVAVPISWDELAGGIDPAAFTIHTVPERLATRADPWRGLTSSKQGITAAARRAAGAEP